MNKKLIIIVSTLVGASVVGYFVWRKMKKKKDNAANSGTQGGGNTGGVFVAEGGNTGGGGKGIGISGDAILAGANVVGGIIGNIKNRPKPQPKPTTTTTATTTTGVTTTSGFQNIGRPTGSVAGGSGYKQYTVSVSSGSLNIRSNPNTNAKVIGSLSKGAKVLAMPSSTAGWSAYSKDGKTVTGYVSSKYLS